MNFRLIFRFLGSVVLIIGASMAFSLLWASPALGGNPAQERFGVFGLLASMLICGVIGVGLRYAGRNARQGKLFRKEAMAVVALSWFLATFLGGLPYFLSGVQRCEGVFFSVPDAIFESQSGFSTTGATVFGELENPELLPRTILFWRCTTHYLGGLGIMVLFVVILGQSTAGKAFMKLEMSGKGTSGTPSISHQRMAFCVSGVYFAMTAIGIGGLYFLGLNFYDAICHAFSAVSTGGFSTFNASVGHFSARQSEYPRAAQIEWFIILLMFFGSCNFFLIYEATRRYDLRTLFHSQEFLAYVVIITAATLIIFVSGLFAGDFDEYGTSDASHLIFCYSDPPQENLPAPNLEHSLRLACFQVVAIISTTGFCTDEFEKWNPLALGTIFLIMLIGGCTGSTAGGWKVVRFVVLAKLCGQEIERSYRPNVVRPLRLDGEKLDSSVPYNILIFFAFSILIFMAATFILLVIEPAETWGENFSSETKLVDSVGMVLTTFNNVGPGFGLVGARQNYGHITETSKIILAFLMLLGRLEIMAVLALFHPTFWRN